MLKKLAKRFDPPMAQLFMWVVVPLILFASLAAFRGVPWIDRLFEAFRSLSYMS